MVEISVIQERLQALEDYSAKLNSLKEVSQEELQADFRKQWAVERGLLLAIECLLDITNHLIASLSLKKPKDYTEAILLLGDEKILPAEFCKRIAGMAGFRNLLIHEYLKVDPKKVYEKLQSAPSDFAEFAAHLTAFLKKKGYL